MPQPWKVKVAQSRLTHCDPMDYTVHGTVQARILEWVAIPFSRGSFQPSEGTVFHFIPGKASAYNVGDPGSILGSGRTLGEGNGNPLQYSCLENPMDGEAWYATVHGHKSCPRSWTQLHFHFHPLKS